MEREYKWSFPADKNIDIIFTSELLVGTVLRNETIIMKATYYDTNDHLFSDIHGSLRIREENGYRICCMKLPSYPACNNELCKTREEFEIAAQSITDGLALLPQVGAPKKICEQVAKEKLTKVCYTDFIRQAYTLEIFFESNVCQGELAVDIGLLGKGNSSAPLSEIEFEYIQGDMHLFHLFAQKLEQEFGLKKQTLSKMERALNL